MLAQAIGTDWKDNASLVPYLPAIPPTFFNEWITQAIYAAVALMRLIPSRRIENALGNAAH